MDKLEFWRYYEYYLLLHTNRNNRRLHVLGQLATVLTLVYAIVAQKWLLLLAAPFVVYPFAWAGHLFFEKSTPAAWSKPLWAKVCDWVMLKDILTGKIEW